jgi:serine protease Do
MKKGSSFKRFLSTILLSAAGAFFVPVFLGAAPSAMAASAAAGFPDFADMVDKAGPAVVNIRTTEKLKPGQNAGSAEEEEMQEYLRRFFGLPVPRQQQQVPHGRHMPQQQEEEVPRGIGSGFIISADGYVLTNAHVIEGADEVYVTLTDKREFKAKVIGSDSRTDVALVKIEGNNLPRLPIGDSSKIRVGEWVIAIGSPFGFDNTVTAGVISAKARDVGDYVLMIQTDVAVNQGNSGGPLINLRGEVIGINSMIYGNAYLGISFAVPIDEAMHVVEQLKTTGKVTRGRIGVQIGEVTKDVAESLGMNKAQGALVRRVEPGTPAEKGGMKPGDIILKFNGTPIERSNDLPRLVGNSKPGTRATITIWRGGATRDLSLVIAESEGDKAAKKEEKKAKPEIATNALGLIVSDLSDAQKKELKVDAGVIVESADGRAFRAGLRPGDVILQLNNTEVKDAKQFNAMVAKLDQKKTTAVLVRRGEETQFVTIKP